MNNDWHNRLLGDPAPWLLDADDNPSVYFWFQRDIVGRPEDAPAMIAARDRILYSAPVQGLYAAQDESGFWDNPDSLDTPLHRATLWSLELLAELGVACTSRRARAACEFVLERHLDASGSVRLADPALAGPLVRALHYFGFLRDPRVAHTLDQVVDHASEGNLFALLALLEISEGERSSAMRSAIERGTHGVLDALGRGAYSTFGAFPSFDASDLLLALRVLARAGRVDDPRAHRALEEIWERQREGARWCLDKSYNGTLAVRLEDAGVPSKWATLNVLRIVTRCEG